MEKTCARRREQFRFGFLSTVRLGLYHVLLVDHLVRDLLVGVRLSSHRLGLLVEDHLSSHHLLVVPILVVRPSLRISDLNFEQLK